MGEGEAIWCIKFQILGQSQRAIYIYTVGLYGSQHL